MLKRIIAEIRRRRQQEDVARFLADQMHEIIQQYRKYQAQAWAQGHTCASFPDWFLGRVSRK